MTDFIGEPCFVRYIGQACAGPVPPAPPGPYDRVVSANNGLVSYSTPYNSPTGNLVVRIAARNNAASMPGIAISFGGEPLVMADEVCDGLVGSPVAALGVLKDGPIGTEDLVITTTGSAGFALVRIGDVVEFDLPDDEVIGWQDGQTGTNSLLDFQVVPESPGNGDLAYVACWMSDLAYPIQQFYGAVEQWQSYQRSYGSELLTNGSFASDTGWTKGISWTIGSGVANRNQATGGSLIQQMVAGLVAGQRYEAAATITASGGGTIQAYWRTGAYVTFQPGILPVSEVASYTWTGTAPSGIQGFGFQGVSNPAPGISIDNASLRQITGGMSGYFARQVTPAAGQVTVEASPNPAKGAVLVVELKGLVLP